MTTWILWAVKCCASVFLVLISLPLFVMAANPEVRIVGLVLGVVFAVAGLATWPRRPGAWRSDPPTQKQLEFAERLGIEVPYNATKGEVSALISQVTGR